MKHPALPAVKVAPVMDSVAPGAFAWFTLCSSPAKTAFVLLGLLGLAVVVHVAVPVLKALGVCWAAKLQARLMPSGRPRSRRKPNRTRDRRTASRNVRHSRGSN